MMDPARLTAFSGLRTLPGGAPGQAPALAGVPGFALDFLSAPEREVFAPPGTVSSATLLDVVAMPAAPESVVAADGISVEGLAGNVAPEAGFVAQALLGRLLSRSGATVHDLPEVATPAAEPEATLVGGELPPADAEILDEAEPVAALVTVSVAVLPPQLDHLQPMLAAAAAGSGEDGNASGPGEVITTVAQSVPMPREYKLAALAENADLGVQASVPSSGGLVVDDAEGAVPTAAIGTQSPVPPKGTGPDANPGPGQIDAPIARLMPDSSVAGVVRTKAAAPQQHAEPLHAGRAALAAVPAGAVSAPATTAEADPDAHAAMSRSATWPIDAKDAVEMALLDSAARSGAKRAEAMAVQPTPPQPGSAGAGAGAGAPAALAPDTTAEASPEARAAMSRSTNWPIDAEDAEEMTALDAAARPGAKAVTARATPPKPTLVDVAEAEAPAKAALLATGSAATLRPGGRPLIPSEVVTPPADKPQSQRPLLAEAELAEHSVDGGTARAGGGSTLAGESLPGKTAGKVVLNPEAVTRIAATSSVPMAENLTAFAEPLQPASHAPSATQAEAALPGGAAADGATELDAAWRQMVLDVQKQGWTQALVRRVAGLASTGGTLAVQVYPPALGRMVIRVAETPRGLDLRVSSELAATAAMMGEAEQRISHLLESAGLRLADYSSQTGGAGAQTRGEGGNGSQLASDDAEPSGAPGPRSLADDPAVAQAGIPAGADGRVDLIA